MSLKGDFKQGLIRREHLIMQLLAPSVLLFGLNLLDALLTIVWVRSGVATEGNQLMAHLLDIGNGPFLTVKAAMGFIATLVLVRFGQRRMARYGLVIALAVYIGLMGIHIFTGLSAFGYVSNNMMHELGGLSDSMFAVFI
jgi:hypothetical protein